MLRLPNARPIRCQRWLEHFFSKLSPRTLLSQSYKLLASTQDSFSTMLGNQWDWRQICSIVVSLSFQFSIFLPSHIAHGFFRFTQMKFAVDSRFGQLPIRRSFCTADLYGLRGMWMNWRWVRSASELMKTLTS